MKNHLIFALFAAAILFSVVREWSVPLACLRSGPNAPAVAAEMAR
jgi:hypothetical protein